MIIWNLRKIMDERRIKGKELAEQVGKHPNTIYRMRDAIEMPTVDGKLLNDLCNALDCNLTDLVNYIPDNKKCKSFKVNNSKATHSELTPTESVVAAAIGAAQAVGSTDPAITAKVAASVMQILQALESETQSKQT